MDNARHDVSDVPKNERQALFVERAKAIGSLVRDGRMSGEGASKVLWEDARANDLTGKPGSGSEEVIANVIETEIALTDEPRATNGHDGEPLAPNGPDDYGESIAPVQRSETGKTEKPKRDLPRAWCRDPATIPARSSLYDGHYIRRTIGATIGGGGRAKTTRGIYEAVCMVVGFDIATKEKLPDGELRVWICNGEEDQDELDRRVAAACQRYGIGRADLGAGSSCSLSGMTRCGSPHWSTTGR
jgi:AAA domain